MIKFKQDESGVWQPVYEDKQPSPEKKPVQRKPRAKKQAEPVKEDGV